MESKNTLKGRYKKSMSCREVVTRHLPIIVSDGTVNEREKSRRSRIETLRDDSALCYNGYGFTLIELLVVVLIIGILAAVALPQYQKTVWKSRNATLKNLVKTVAQAEQAYYMANGKYAADFDELSVDLPLAPVATTAGAGTGACNTTVQGTDSVRAGKDFYVTLNSTGTDMHYVLVVAYWSEGKYACAGFGQANGATTHPKLNNFHCREKITGNHYTAGEGAFCNKIEQTTLEGNTDSWRYYLYQ